MPSEVLESTKNEGCRWGWVNRERIKESERRIADIEAKWWAVLFFSFSSLCGIVLNILLTMGKH